MQITRHFNLDEFDCNDGTRYPEEWIESRLKPLCQQMEIIREHFRNRPVRITSGYRTKEYNKKIGGAPKSQHIQGRAADIKINGIPARRVADEILKWIREKKLKLKGLGSYNSFTHIDTRPGRLVRWGWSTKGGKNA